MTKEINQKTDAGKTESFQMLILKYGRDEAVEIIRGDK